MAEQVQLAGTTVKTRNPFLVFVWSIVTFGIYYLVWYYKINREMADLGRATGNTEELGTSPGTSVLAVTLGALILVPAIISLVHTHKRIVASQRITGGGEPLNGWLVLIMFLVGLSVVGYAYWQTGLNKTWEAQSGAAPVPAAAPAPAG
jgi:Domain of unknown function (DUF4234)